MSYVNKMPATIDLPNEIDNLTLMLNASIDCIKIIDKNGNLIKINSAGARALGVLSENIPKDTNWTNLLPIDLRATARSSLKKAFNGRSSSFLGRSKFKGKSPIFWDNILTPIHGSDGSVKAVLCLSRNITRQREAELKLKEASELDQLTKLANRRFFSQTLANRLKTYHKRGKSLGLLIVDLDNFKNINDSLGHIAGDHVLKKVAKKLQKCVGPDDLVGRLGGDEFIIMVSNADTASALANVADHIVNNFDEPVLYKGLEIPVYLSAGGALSSATIRTPHDLLKRSDKCLYLAKQAGRNTYRVHG